MSWIPSSSSRSLPSPSVEREAAAKAGSTPDRDVPSLTRGVSKELEGDVRVRMMTSTYHKLRKALKKGMREMQWQRFVVGTQFSLWKFGSKFSGILIVSMGSVLASYYQVLCNAIIVLIRDCTEFDWTTVSPHVSLSLNSQ